MLCPDDTRKDAQAAGFNYIIVISSRSLTPASLGHPPPAVIGRELFHLKDAMPQAEHMRIGTDPAVFHFVV
jgi:hypothetical protein